jgi:hypothetical protein
MPHFSQLAKNAWSRQSNENRKSTVIRPLHFSAQRSREGNFPGLSTGTFLTYSDASRTLLFLAASLTFNPKFPTSTTPLN